MLVFFDDILIYRKSWEDHVQHIDKVLSSNGMKKILKKGHQGVIAQLCSLDVQTSKSYIPQDIQGIIDKHSKVFEDIPKGFPPT